MSGHIQPSLAKSFAGEAVEAKRRQKATVTGGESTLTDDTGYMREFKTDDQKFVLWNMANRDLPPCTPLPAVRILGLFPDQETAIQHAHGLAAAGDVAPIRLSTTHEWYTIPESGDRDVDACRLKVNRNLLAHQNMLQDHSSEFKQRHDALTKGRTPALEAAKEANEQVLQDEESRKRRRELLAEAAEKDAGEIADLEKVYEEECAERATALVSAERGEAECKDGAEECKGGDEEEEYVETPLVPAPRAERFLDAWESTTEGLSGVTPPQVPRVYDVRNQRYAVMSVVADYETKTDQNPVGQEPGVIVWAAFDSEEEAIKYNKVVASKELRDHDLAVVTMYEWLYPNVMSADSVIQLYRNEELDNIMKHARTSSAHVRSFEQECEDAGKPCDARNIEPDLAAPAPRRYVPPAGSDLELTYGEV